jgi:hypothetical protein
MRLVLLFGLLVATIWLGAPAMAQEAAQPGKMSPAPPGDAIQPTSQDAKDLDRIREALAKPLPSLILNVDVPADFKVEVNEQQKLDDLLKSLDFRAGPVPAGGLYAYEQQRLVFNPTNYPMMQPYAAFSGSELLTLAVESLAGHYAGGKALSALSEAERNRARAAARADVLRSIADYCAARPDRGAGIPICEPPPDIH